METEGTLATAIEKNGIYTWDRFGRFGLADEAGKVEALGLLAAQYAWKQELYSRGQSPLEQCEGPDSVFERYGWKTKVCPDFNVIRLGQSEREPRQSKSGETNSRNTLLVIIAALCDYSAIDPAGRSAAGQIAKLTEEFGAAVTDDTIRNVLSKIPDALEARKQ